MVQAQCEHVSREQLVGITDQMVQAGGDMDGGAGGGAGGMGRVDGANSGGHRLEEGDKGAVEGDGAGCSVKGLGEVHRARQGV